MKILSLFISVLLLIGCDFYWSVKNEKALNITSAECLEQAIASTEGIKSVIQIDPGERYTLSGKAPKPIVFRFESDIATGSVIYDNNIIKAIFSDHGTSAPPEISSEGPEYLESIINNIGKACGKP